MMEFSQSHDKFLTDPQEENRQSLNQLITDEAVCRTALATPGLLISSIIFEIGVPLQLLQTKHDILMLEY